MKMQRLNFLPRASIGLMLLALTTINSGAAAAPATPSQPSSFEREREVCLSGQSNQDRATCLREAAAARADASRGAAGADEPTLQTNRLKRCAPLPEPDRRDCELRMSGAGTRSGSAAAGGIYRELITREPATPAVPASLASPAVPASPAASAAN